MQEENSKELREGHYKSLIALLQKTNIDSKGECFSTVALTGSSCHGLHSGTGAKAFEPKNKKRKTIQTNKT
jgi:hypothetical protein